MNKNPDRLGKHVGEAYVIDKHSNQNSQTEFDAIDQLLSDGLKHAEIEAQIHDLGEQGVGQLSQYLQEGANHSISSRLLAVELLSKISGDAAISELRRLFYKPVPDNVNSEQTIAEKEVKQAVLQALASRSADGAENEICYGLTAYRLAAAARIAVQHKQSSLVPTLVNVISDDDLGREAQGALIQFGSVSIPPLLQLLSRQGGNIQWEQAVRAIEVLVNVSSANSMETLVPIIRSANVTLATAGALAIQPFSPQEHLGPIAFVLARAALLPSQELADRALGTLINMPPDLLIQGCEEALKLTGIALNESGYPPYQVTEQARIRLAAAAIRAANAINPSGVAAVELPDTLMAQALRELVTLRQGPYVPALSRHDDADVRSATLYSLAASGDPGTARYAIDIMKKDTNSQDSIRAGLTRLSPSQRQRYLAALRANLPSRWRWHFIHRIVRQLEVGDASD